jgi:uncharacterized protein (TIGR02453 family)
MASFTKPFLSFLKDLSDNNNREWFQENKKRFEKDVKAPFTAFVDELIGRVNAVNPEIVLEPKDAIFRIYRDIRFSKDKTPYKTHMAAIIARGGRKGMREPGLYIQFSAADARIYSGLYMIEKNDLTLVRRHIAYNMDDFSRLIQDKTFKKVFGEIHGEKNKILPAEFVEDAAQQPLIANKNFYYFAVHKPEIVLEDNLTDLIMEHYTAAAPLNAFFSEALVEEDAL